MFVKRKFDRIVLVTLVLGAVAYAAFQPRFHLREDMPVEFFDASAPPAQRKANEQKVAQMYWDCAVKEIQWKYGYAHRLPDTPPPEFAITGPSADDQAIRERYWQKVRMVWNLPSAWKTDYGLDMTSMKRSFQSAGDWLQDLMWRLTGRP
ncbi:MAG TPA: hypothetical protein VJQ82_21910 [Terriglobales bacterium]|nr:hypothetical protein [Terriglobales bacterium]